MGSILTRVETFQWRGYGHTYDLETKFMGGRNLSISRWGGWGSYADADGHDVGRPESMANGEVTVGTLAADGRYGAGGVSNDEVSGGYNRSGDGGGLWWHRGWTWEIRKH